VKQSRLICCKSCGRVAIPGLSKTQEAIVAKLANARRPLLAVDLWAGLHTDVRSAHVQISNLRHRLEPHGFTIPISGNRRGHRALYSIGPIHDGTHQ
jgi:hypothetical protein